MATGIYTNVAQRPIAADQQTNVPTNEVGTDIARLFPSGARLLRSDKRTDGDATTTYEQFDSAGWGKANVFRRTDEVRNAEGEVTERSTMLQIQYAPDHKKTFFADTDGKVRAIIEDSPKGQAEWRDSDHDGRIDQMMEEIGRLENFTAPAEIDGFVRTSEVHARHLTDTDGDGKFDTETIAADWKKFLG